MKTGGKTNSDALIAEMLCADCWTTKHKNHRRDADAQCIHCGVRLCGSHIANHLQKSHQVWVK
ncbi:MAG: hypothetical protein V1909_03870 [Candidatus Micrarchaeota archaeon]